MKQPEYSIEVRRRDANGQATVTVYLDEEPVFTDRINVLKANQRNTPTARLAEQYPGLDPEEVRQRLEHAANHHDSKDKGNGNEEPQYEIRKDGIYYLRPTDNGRSAVQLSNFTVSIVAEVTRDDGTEISRVFSLEAQLNGTILKAQVPAEEFAAMRWVIKHLGATAIVSPGNGNQDRLRAAIQTLSRDIKQVRTYTHTGWTCIKGQWGYLHSNGLIGREGNNPDVSVELEGVLESFRFPPPPRRQANAGSAPFKSAHP